MFAPLMGLKVIKPNELQQWMPKQGVIILDVNARQSWLAERVPGALSLDPAAFKESDLPADKNSMRVFYCSNFFCRKAPNAARRAKEMGYGNVYVMSAGVAILSRTASRNHGPRYALPEGDAGYFGFLSHHFRDSSLRSCRDPEASQHQVREVAVAAFLCVTSIGTSCRLWTGDRLLGT